MAQITSVLGAFASARATAGHDTHIELELRFAIQSTDEYKMLVSKVARESALLPVSRTIALIRGNVDTGSDIATQTYKDTGLRVEKDGPLVYSTKRPLSIIKISDEFVPYKVAVAAEANGAPFDIQNTERFRVKLRLSALPAALANWRFDFTLAIELESRTSLVSSREALFRPGLTPETFVDSAPFEVAGKLEFEAEWIGSDIPDSAAIYALLDYVRDTGGFKYNQSNEYQQVVFEIAKLLKPSGEAEKFRSKLGRKHLTPAPVGLDKKLWRDKVAPNITNMMLTIKADGEGIIGLIADKTIKTIAGDLRKVELKEAIDKPIVYEAELLADGRELIYDVLYIDGALLLGHLPLRERIKRIPEVVAIIGSAKSAHVKEYIQPTTNYAAELKRIWTKKYDFPVDGIIIDSAYKWKPTNHLTIDMLVMRPPAAGVIGTPPHVNKPGHELYFLFVGIERSQQAKFRIRNVVGYNTIFAGRTLYGYYPIQFAPPSKPHAYIYYAPIDKKEAESIHGHICEFRWDREADAWALVRVRTDRDVEVARGSYFGNNIHVAFSTWDNIQDPLTFEMLCGQDDDSAGPYFAKTMDRYKPANWFSAFAKEHSLKEMRDLSWVIDLAAGRGADLGRWGRARIKNALCVDTDAAALIELQRRQTEQQRGLKHYKTTVYTHRADLRDDHTATADMIEATFPLPKDGVPLIVCNMAIHYFCASDVSISNFVLLVDRLCAPGGHFVFTCFNGGRIFDQLRGKDRVDSYVGESLAFSIVRRYPEDAEFAEYGQMIEPMLACSGMAHVPEYLVNIPYVLSQFKGRGFELVRQVAFGSLLEEYSIDNLENYDKLAEADIENVSRYDYVILKKSGGRPTERKTAAPTGGHPSLIETKTIDTALALAPEVNARFGSGIIATKKATATLSIAEPEARPIADGRIRNIALPGLAKFAKLTVSDRVTIVSSPDSSFDVVVEGVANYSTLPKLFAAMPISQLDLSRDQDEWTKYWLAAHDRARLGKGGVILLTVRGL